MSPASLNVSPRKPVSPRKFKKAAELVTRVNLFTSALKSGVERANENSIAPVGSAPACLTKVLSQIRSKDKAFASDAKEKRRVLNQRLVNSLFISNIDTEEVEAAMTNIDYDLSALTTVEGRCYVPADTQYQTISKSRYDAGKNQLVFSTAMTVMETAEADSAIVPSPHSLTRPAFQRFPSVKEKPFSLIKDRTPDPSAQSVSTSYELSKKLNPEFARETIHRLVEVTTNLEQKNANEAAPHRKQGHRSAGFKSSNVDSQPIKSQGHPNQSKSKAIPMISTISGEKIPITREESEHYFGDVARIHFYDRMRKIMAKMNQIAPYGPCQKYLQHREKNEDEEDDAEDTRIGSAYFQDDSSTIVTSATMSAAFRGGYQTRVTTGLSALPSSSMSHRNLPGSSSAVSSVYDPTLPASIAVHLSGEGVENSVRKGSDPAIAADAADLEDPSGAVFNPAPSSGSLASTFRAHQQKPLPNVSSGSISSGIAASRSIGSLVSSSLPSLSPEFFTELGNLASNDHVKRHVDRDLLSVPKQRKNVHLSALSMTSANVPAKSNRSKSKRKTGKIQLAPIDAASVSSTLTPLQKKRMEENVGIQQYLQQEKRKREMLLATSSNYVDASSTFEKHSSLESVQSSLPLNSADKSISLANSLSASVLVSPRTRYITHCLQAGLTPLPHMILRREYTTTLNLAHYALGDVMGRILAHCLCDLPCLEHIDLNDNQLTDDSLQFIIQAIISIPTIRVLNLSRNKIDGYSSTALAEFVARPDCPIETLILQSADVDDGECADFVQNLVTNEKLVELDLSSNLLGSATGIEPSNDASDELLPLLSTSGAPNDPPETGGEALALFIASSSCRLQTLRLSWNTMRGYPAKMLMQYISYNHTLTFLDLSCNGLGPIAGEILGDALISNKTLRTLLVNNNQFTASATVSICIGITENFSLRRIEMNENPIGMLGGKMIMANAVSWGSRVVVEAKNCNTTMAFDERAGWFDPTNPCQSFQLQLAKPLHRAIAIYLLHLVATHSTYIVQSASYEPPKGKGGGGKPERLEFVQGIARDREDYFDEEQKKVVAGLRLIASAASNMELAKQLFYEADADRSGKLDKDELQEVLEKIGFPIDVDRLNDIFAVFDVDGAGSIDMSEFILLLKAQARDAYARIRDMTEYPITALKTGSYSPSMVPSEKYVPPRQGTLHLSITDGFVQKDHFLTMTTIDQKFAYHMAKRIGDVSWMNEAVRNTKVRYDEGLALFKTLFRELQDIPLVLMQVIPQMMFPSESRQLIAKVTKNNPKVIARVKFAFGVALRPLLGAFNGYYCLDLSKEIHRLCLSRLLEQSQTWNFHQRRSTYNIIGPSKIGDVSQHGNWTCFRNEVLNGQPIKVTAQKFQPMPHSGTVEFDFACAPKRSGQELIMSDKRVCKVLTNLAILPMENFTDGINKCNAWRKKSQEKSKDGALFMPMYAFDPRKAVESGKAMDIFYDSVKERQIQLRQGKKKEVSLARIVSSRSANASDKDSPSKEDKKKHQPKNGNASKVNNSHEENDDNDDDSRSTASSSSSSSSGSSRSSSPSGSSRSSPSESTTPVSRSQSRGGDGTSTLAPTEKDTATEDEAEGNDDDDEDEENQQRRRLEAQRKRLVKMLYTKKNGMSLHGRAAKLLEVIEDTFGQLWLYTRHVALIVFYFQQIFDMQNNNIGPSRDFGSYVVELIVLLFGRIVDVHNFELLLGLLDPKDCGALFCRLGIMMLFNPMKPEVTYELDMDRREERLLAKLIVYLSVVEPGINLTFKQFQWKREMDYIPGWELTDMWCTEDGMPIHGKLVFTYYSGEGRNKSGCVPDVFLRKALCAMTVIDEEAATRDEDAEVPLDEDATGKKTQRAGEKHYQENKDIWINYLSVAAERDGSDGRYV